MVKTMSWVVERDKQTNKNQSVMNGETELSTGVLEDFSIQGT